MLMVTKLWNAWYESAEPHLICNNQSQAWEHSMFTYICPVHNGYLLRNYITVFLEANSTSSPHEACWGLQRSRPWENMTCWPNHEEFHLFLKTSSECPWSEKGNGFCLTVVSDENWIFFLQKMLRQVILLVLKYLVGQTLRFVLRSWIVASCLCFVVCYPSGCSSRTVWCCLVFQCEVHCS